MDGARYEPHFDGSIQGVVIGPNPNVTNIFQSVPPAASWRSILGTPPLTDPSSIQQRTTLVEAIITQLTQPRLNALVFTGIGGVGKSTLAALIYRTVEAQYQQATVPFAVPPLWLSIDVLTTFADIMGTIYQALGKSLPDLNTLSPAHQAQALCNLLSTAPSQLIVLDQFGDYLLDWKTGEVLPDRPSIGEWLDALNSQPWDSGCRLLFTSRPKPKGTRAYASLGLQEYPTGGLTIAEGMDLFYKRGVQAQEADLRKAVIYCNGHALSLTLLVALVQEYAMPLADLLTDTALWAGDIATNLLNAIFRHLSDVQRDLLRAFSIYRTAVPIEAAQAVFSALSQRSILPALRTLLTQHLVQAIPERSYQLHAIVASYAKEHFVEGDELENQHAVEQAHSKAAQYCIQQEYPSREQRKRVSDVFWIVEAVWQLMQAAQWQEAYTLMVQEELLAGLDLWGSAILSLEMSRAFLSQKVWQLAPEQRAFVSIWIGRSYDGLGKKPEALHYYEQAVTICREVGHRSGEGAVLNDLGGVYSDLGKKPEALHYLEQALAIQREVGDRSGEGTTLNNLGMVYDALGQKPEALHYLEQALAIQREVGDRSMEGVTLGNIGAVFLSQECYEAALAALAALFLARHIFEEVLSPDQEVVQGWIDGLCQAVGDEAFAALHARVEPQAEQILQQALRQGID